MSDLQHNEDEISLQAYALEFCTDAVISFNQRGEVTRFNPAAEKLLDYTSQEILGRTDDPLKLLPVLASAKKARSPLQVDQRKIILRNKSGLSLDLMLTVINIPAIPKAGTCCLLRLLTPAEIDAEHAHLDSDTTLTVGASSSKPSEQQDTKLDTLRPITVLVVDDNPHIQSLVQSILERNSIAALTAADPQSAILLLQSIPKTVEVALIDYSLLEEKDPSLVQKLRTLNPQMKVILTSGYDLEDLRDECDPLQIDYFLPKPFLPTNLLQAVLLAAKLSDPREVQ